eukprot:SAG31_NODE_1344_length_8699_cov_15.971512_7_plen_172_part_00
MLCKKRQGGATIRSFGPVWTSSALERTSEFTPVDYSPTVWRLNLPAKRVATSGRPPVSPAARPVSGQTVRPDPPQRVGEDRPSVNVIVPTFAESKMEGVPGIVQRLRQRLVGQRPAATYWFAHTVYGLAVLWTSRKRGSHLPCELSKSWVPDCSSTRMGFLGVVRTKYCRL